MEGLADRTGQSSILEGKFSFVVEVGWEVEIEVDLSDATRRFGRHDFRDFDFGITDVDTESSGSEVHERQHTTAECSRNQVGRREKFAFAVVVERGIGNDFVTRVDMGSFGAEVTQIYCLNRSHKENYLYMLLPANIIKIPGSVIAESTSGECDRIKI